MTHRSDPYRDAFALANPDATEGSYVLYGFGYRLNQGPLHRLDVTTRPSWTSDREPIGRDAPPCVCGLTRTIEGRCYRCGADRRGEHHG